MSFKYTLFLKLVCTDTLKFAHKSTNDIVGDIPAKYHSYLYRNNVEIYH